MEMEQRNKSPVNGYMDTNLCALEIEKKMFFISVSDLLRFLVSLASE